MGRENMTPSILIVRTPSMPRNVVYKLGPYQNHGPVWTEHQVRRAQADNSVPENWYDLGPGYRTDFADESDLRSFQPCDLNENPPDPDFPYDPFE